MNMLIQRCRLAIAGLLLAAVPMVAVHAQDAEAKPVAVVSIAPMKKVLADVQYLADAAQQTEAGRTAVLLTTPFTVGVDKSRPCGVMFMTDGMGLSPIAYLPAEDYGKMITTASEQIGPPQDVGGDIKMFNVGLMPVFVKSVGTWAVLATDQEKLANPPADPLVYLKELPTEYDLALKVFPLNVPAVHRQWAMDQLRTGVELSLEQEPNETNEEFAARKKQIDQQLDEVNRLFTELEDLTIGWNVDATQQGTYIDIATTVVDGSQYAKVQAMNSDLTTEFLGFSSESAAFSFRMTQKMADEDIQRLTKQINEARDQSLRQLVTDGDLDGEDLESAKKVIDLAIDTVIQTAKTGSFDGGMMIDIANGKVTALTAAHVADGQRVEDVFKEIIKIAAKNGEQAPPIQWNTDSYKTVRLSTMKIPMDGAPPEAQQYLGDSPEVVLGIGETSVYMTAGYDAMARMKKAIDDSLAGTATKVPSLHMQLAALPFLKLAKESPAPPFPGIDQVIAVLEKGNDKLLMTVTVDGNKSRLRIMIQEGLIQAAGAGVVAATSGVEVESELEIPGQPAF